MKPDSGTTSVKREPAVITETLSLEIYARDKATVQPAKEKILSIIESQKKREKIEDDIIEKLSTQQISDIEYVGEVFDVKITVDEKLNRILVDGHGDDVAKRLSKFTVFWPEFVMKKRKKWVLLCRRTLQR